MDADKINQFLMLNGKYFPNDQLPTLKQALEDVDDSQFNTLVLMNYKDPTVALILSLLLGAFAVDRFYVGNVGVAVAKLLVCAFTLWTIGTIWVIVDWFLIMGATRQKNLDMFYGNVALYAGAPPAAGQTISAPKPAPQPGSADSDTRAT